ncbi:MAG TPA: DUF2946 family protein [Burkholderiales bacterium]|nr:DUF2946 family protein [Burkholderiales bacterium]
MDEAVLRSLAKWPDVPDVYGWLSLDRRGNWLLKGEKIGNQALRDFISRNYQPDARGCWYFQNGPQRVFAQLAYTPLVVHLEGEALVDHCGRAFAPAQAFVDEEGSVLMQGKPGLALLDDRDLPAYEERAEGLPRVTRAEVQSRFGFVRNPAP